jgi:hypothetical protein
MYFQTNSSRLEMDGEGLPNSERMKINVHTHLSTDVVPWTLRRFVIHRPCVRRGNIEKIPVNIVLPTSHASLKPVMIMITDHEQVLHPGDQLLPSGLVEYVHSMYIRPVNSGLSLSKSSRRMAISLIAN